VNTNRTLALIVVVLGLVVLPGCWTTSLHALYEEGDQHLTYDSALIGVWQNLSDSPIAITGDPSTGFYNLEASDEDGRYGYSGGLVQLGPYRFLDVVPSASYDKAGKSQEIEPGYFRAHSILRVILEGDSLSLMAPNDGRLCAAARENKLTLGDCVDGDFMFTAQTAVLQEYFLKHADDLEVFDKTDPDSVLHRQAVKQGATQ